MAMITLLAAAGAGKNTTTIENGLPPSNDESEEVGRDANRRTLLKLAVMLSAIKVFVKLTVESSMYIRDPYAAVPEKKLQESTLSVPGLRAVDDAAKKAPPLVAPAEV